VKMELSHGALRSISSLNNYRWHNDIRLIFSEFCNQRIKCC